MYIPIFSNIDIVILMFPCGHSRNLDAAEKERKDYGAFAQFEAVHRGALMAAHDVVAKAVYASHGVTEASMELAVRKFSSDPEYLAAERELGGALRRIFWPSRVVELHEEIEEERQIEALEAFAERLRSIYILFLVTLTL